MHTPGRIGSTLLALAAFVAIGSSAFAADAPAPGADEAASIWKSRCTLCHGEGGKGDGPVAAALNPKPRDLTDAKWQQSVTDDHIEAIIKGGGGAVGLSPVMPANNDLVGKPDVVKALRSLVRGFGGKAGHASRGTDTVVGRCGHRSHDGPMLAQHGHGGCDA